MAPSAMSEAAFCMFVHVVLQAQTPGGGYFQVKDYWGCAAGWGRIFTTRLTTMGLHF